MFCNCLTHIFRFFFSRGRYVFSRGKGSNIGFWTDATASVQKRHIYAQNFLAAPNFNQENLENLRKKKESPAELVGLKYVLLSDDVHFCEII